MDIQTLARSTRRHRFWVWVCVPWSHYLISETFKIRQMTDGSNRGFERYIYGSSTQLIRTPILMLVLFIECFLVPSAIVPPIKRSRRATKSADLESSVTRWPFLFQLGPKSGSILSDERPSVSSHVICDYTSGQFAPVTMDHNIRNFIQHRSLKQKNILECIRSFVASLFDLKTRRKGKAIVAKVKIGNGIFNYVELQKTDPQRYHSLRYLHRSKSIRCIFPGFRFAFGLLAILGSCAKISNTLLRLNHY